MEFMSKLSTTLENFFTFFPPSELTVLVGVSGGPDSVALLDALVTYSKTHSNLKIEVAHLNHQLRGADADADAAFVSELAANYNLPLHLAAFDVASFAEKSRLSVESAARGVRYAFFAHIMTFRQISLLLLAHNADDQAETVMLHLLRGSGLHGLTGMSELADFPLPANSISPFDFDSDFMRKARIGRPLLNVWRNEIEAYCNERDLSPKTDYTNLETEYFRNKLRLQLLPEIESEYKPGFKKNLVRLAGLLQADETLLQKLTQQAFERIAIFNNNSVDFDLVAFLVEPTALQSRLLRLAYQNLTGTLENLESLHIELILQALTNVKAQNFALDLPNNVIFRKTSAKLSFTSKNSFATLQMSQPQLSDTVESLNLLFDNIPLELKNSWQISATKIAHIDLANLYQTNRFCAYLDFDKIGKMKVANLVIRRRKAGERFQPLGAPGKRKLQDVLLDAKIPKELRENWPIVAANDSVVWVAGCNIADDFKVTPDTDQILEIKLFRELE